MDAAVAALRREQILVTQINPVKEKAAKKAPVKKGGKKVRFEGFLGPQATNLFEMTRVK